VAPQNYDGSSGGSYQATGDRRQGRQGQQGRIAALRDRAPIFGPRLGWTAGDGVEHTINDNWFGLTNPAYGTGGPLWPVGLPPPRRGGVVATINGLPTCNIMLGVSLRQNPAKGFQSLNSWLAIRRVVVDLAPLVPNSHALTT